MSMAMTHFAFGATCATVLVSVLRPGSRYDRTLILASGCWAMVPDLHQIAPALVESWALHEAPLSNLFWFHGLLDAADPTDSPKLAAAMLGVFFLVTLVSEGLIAVMRSESGDERRERVGR